MASLRLRFEWLVISLFLVQSLVRGRIGLELPNGRLAVVLWALATIGLVAVLANQDSADGLPVMIAGLAANLLVVLANGGMPYLVPPAWSGAIQSGFYRPVGGTTLFSVLGDVLPIPGGWLVSVGDVLLMVGAGAFVASAARRGTQETRIRA
jgi:hypothetical protein